MGGSRRLERMHVFQLALSPEVRRDARDCGQRRLDEQPMAAQIQPFAPHRPL